MSRIAKLTPQESAALTRQAMAYCLGKGAISFYSRTWSFSVSHKRAHRELAYYQRSRLQRFLPNVKEPKWTPSYNQNSKENAGTWTLRVASRCLETAHRLLYPGGTYEISSSILELLGIEAIASLWADRGKLLLNRRKNAATGRLVLVRHGFMAAQVIHDWIYTLTGASGRISHAPRSSEIPAIYYDELACEKLMAALRGTWMSKAECLALKFRTPDVLCQGYHQRLATEELLLKTIRSGGDVMPGRLPRNDRARAALWLPCELEAPIIQSQAKDALLSGGRPETEADLLHLPPPVLRPAAAQ